MSWAEHYRIRKGEFENTVEAAIESCNSFLFLTECVDCLHRTRYLSHSLCKLYLGLHQHRFQETSGCVFCIVKLRWRGDIVLYLEALSPWNYGPFKTKAVRISESHLLLQDIATDLVMGETVERAENLYQILCNTLQKVEPPWTWIIFRYSLLVFPR